MKSVAKKSGNGAAPVKQIGKKSYNLNHLLKGISAKNVHKSVDFGAPMGKEVW